MSNVEKLLLILSILIVGLFVFHPHKVKAQEVIVGGCVNGVCVGSTQYDDCVFQCTNGYTASGLIYPCQQYCGGDTAIVVVGGFYGGYYPRGGYWGHDYDRGRGRGHDRGHFDGGHGHDRGGHVDGGRNGEHNGGHEGRR